MVVGSHDRCPAEDDRSPEPAEAEPHERIGPARAALRGFLSLHRTRTI
jgi:hypothetical protein